MKILVLIVTYNPVVEFVAKNLVFFKNYSVLIVDNASSNVNELHYLREKYDHVKIVENNYNKGIACALNQGLNYAKQNSFDFLLTMDQDSSFRSEIDILAKGFETSENVGVVCPSIFDRNSKKFDIVAQEYQEVPLAITSGCLCRVASLLDVGGFDDKLFIDYVDFDICLRLYNRGFKIVRSRDCILNHSLGNSRVYTLLGLKFVSTNHEPFRRYYNARNRIYLSLTYFKSNPKIILGNLMSFLKTLIIIAFLEDDKIHKFKAICKGVYDGARLKKRI